jgi:hypothetical protein
MRWVKHVARMSDINDYDTLIGKPDGKRQLRRLRHRWKDDI